MFDHFTNVHAVFTQLVVFVTCYSSGCVGGCANFLDLRCTQVWRLLTSKCYHYCVLSISTVYDIFA